MQCGCEFCCVSLERRSGFSARKVGCAYCASAHYSWVNPVVRWAILVFMASLCIEEKSLFVPDLCKCQILHKNLYIFFCCFLINRHMLTTRENSVVFCVGAHLCVKWTVRVAFPSRRASLTKGLRLKRLLGMKGKAKKQKRHSLVIQKMLARFSECFGKCWVGVGPGNWANLHQTFRLRFWLVCPARCGHNMWIERHCTRVGILGV